ncbi:hypothetical protein GFB82_21070 [Acinetobacter baumannii]|uniref:hypothetical protein n=1 Tax=Acinetobacter baumannii TaxID=470 RepID=UPI001EF0F5D3|nr:hypothetical protein [Acinetobacter baumannii]MCG6572840.1 hypothetical protein [Acinetobacter baumannii]
MRGHGAYVFAGMRWRFDGAPVASQRRNRFPEWHARCAHAAVVFIMRQSRGPVYPCGYD